MTRTPSAPNPALRAFKRKRGESNLAWGQRAAQDMNTGDPAQWTHLVLMGGSDLLSFRVRIAQAHLRSDMLPSYWSDAALVVIGEGPLAQSAAIHVPLLQPDGPQFATWSNGVVERPLAAFDDARRWPNVALIAMPVPQTEIIDAITEFSRSRQVVDALAHVLRWLAFAWGSEGAPNPLHDNYGLPSACLLESVFARQQFDLTPGVESRRSCPESIWAAARRWHGYYAKVGASGADGKAGRTPVGRYVTDHTYPIHSEPDEAVERRRQRG